ncbi:214_t:CDS:2 [Acaulospora colombiana]|uniref:214_t:CDS:1 n=1 Tax=Acaulospora colombiana TaxID=27376 RepID=A0ACA9K6N0_9GLOM|nr:214_t:CDS:2 [Acaulospora colombiana]
MTTMTTMTFNLEVLFANVHRILDPKDVQSKIVPFYLPDVIEAIKIAFTQEEQEIIREALSPLSESSFFGEVAKKYLYELNTASKSFLNFKNAVEMKFPYRNDIANFNLIKNPDIDLILTYGRILSRQFEVIPFLENISERQWIEVVENHFAAALDNILDCFWEPNDKRIWNTFETKPVKKYADAILTCLATKMIFFILEINGRPGDIPDSELKADYDKIAKCFAYLFDEMLQKRGPFSSEYFKESPCESQWKKMKT